MIGPVLTSAIYCCQYRIFLSFGPQIYLLNSVACLYLSFSDEHSWFLYLNVNIDQCMSLVRLMSWLRLVNHVLVVAFSIYDAHAWVPAVTMIVIIGGIRFINLSFVVVGYFGFDICHAATVQFKRISVEILWSGFDLRKCWSMR